MEIFGIFWRRNKDRNRSFCIFLVLRGLLNPGPVSMMFDKGFWLNCSFSQPFNNFSKNFIPHPDLESILIVLFLFQPSIQINFVIFSEDNGGNDVILRQGENVVVIGASTRRGHLVVEKSNHTIHVPYHFLELRSQS